MDERHTWLGMYIYYSSGKWSNLFSGCLLPMIRRLGRQGLVSDVQIYLGAGKREYVKLILCAPVDVRELCFDMADRYVKKFLRRYPVYETEAPCLPMLFKSYPSNSVWYEVTDREFYQANDEKGEVVRAITTLVSSNLLSALRDDEIGEEELLSYSVYLVFSMVKVLSRGHTSSVEVLSAAIPRLKNLPIPDVAEVAVFGDNLLLDALCGDSWDILREIQEHVWKDELRGPSLQWLDECEASLSGIYSHSPAGWDLCDLTTSVLYQLGIRMNSFGHRSLLGILKNVLESRPLT